MRTIKLENGHLLVPKRAEGPDGLIGDGVLEIDETHPDYEFWSADLERQSARDRKQGSSAQKQVGEGEEHEPDDHAERDDGGCRHL